MGGRRGESADGAERARSPRSILGARGEQWAVDFLLGRGYTVLDRNWRCRAGEIDIVAAQGSTVVFVEVKTRSGVGYGAPAEAVTGAKIRRLRRLALGWLAAQDGAWPTVRFDVIAVLARPGGEPLLEHIEAVC